MIRRLALVAVAFAVPSFVALRAASDVAPGRTYSDPCMADTVVQNHVLNTVKSVLDAPTLDTLMAERRARMGLTGLAFSQVTEIQDSTTCESARLAYTGLVYPDVADTAKRRNFLETLPAVMVVRLTSNRILLASDVYDPIFLFEMFLVDSNYALVRPGF